MGTHLSDILYIKNIVEDVVRSMMSSVADLRKFLFNKILYMMWQVSEDSTATEFQKASAAISVSSRIKST